MGRIVLAGVVASVIVAISAPLASAQAESCKDGLIQHRGFKVAQPPRAIPEEPVATDGEKVASIKDFKGKGVVMNFWATWCPPCVKEMPSISRLQAKLAGGKENITVVTVSQDRLGEPVVKKFLEQAGISNLPVWFDQKVRFSQAAGVSGLPTTLLIDAQGRERARLLGPAEWDSPEILKMIKACAGS